MWCATSQRLLPALALSVDYVMVDAVTSVRNLGVYIGADLSMRNYIQQTMSWCLTYRLNGTVLNWTNPILSSLILSVDASKFESNLYLQYQSCSARCCRPQLSAVTAVHCWTTKTHCEPRLCPHLYLLILCPKRIAVATVPSSSVSQHVSIMLLSGCVPTDSSWTQRRLRVGADVGVAPTAVVWNFCIFINADVSMRSHVIRTV